MADLKVLDSTMHHEETGDGDPIECTRVDAVANERSGLVAAGIEHGHRHVGLDGARFFHADAFDGQSFLHAEPEPAEDRSQHAVPEQQEIAECVHARGDHRIVGGGDGLEGEIAGRIERVGKQRAGRDVNGVGTLALAPFRDLDRVGEHVSFFLPGNDIVAVDRTELHL